MKTAGILAATLLFSLSIGWKAQKAPVYVTASFIDENNLFIEDLEQDEVRILENGEAREIEFMARDELPSIYGILLDRGMLGVFLEEERLGNRNLSRAPTARNILYELIDKFLGRQALWVGAYERQLQILLNYSLDGFKAKETIQQLRGRRNPEDSFLYGAILSAVQKMNQHHEKRRILLVVLGSLDAETAGKIGPLKNLLSHSNVELFVISFTSKLGSSRDTLPPAASQAALKELAQATAGDAFFTMNYGDHLEDIVRRVHNHMRTFYTFGFSSGSALDKPGELTIQCTRPGSRVSAHPGIPIVN